MEITAALVKQLREATGAPVLDCKKALEANGGDLEKAKAWLAEKGLASAAKKAGRAAEEGRVEVYIHPGNRVGVMVEVNCETDFVAKTNAFQSFAHEVALHIAFANPKYLDVTDLPADVVSAEKDKLRERALADGRPEKIADKIVEGQIEKFLQEVCLLRQPFIKDEKVTIGDLLKQTVATIGENVVIRRFARFELGAGAGE
ncbi:MAG: translation elongation factor Ts [Chloroflexi bacterium]|nr:translation elongation factor Ts [Chloroflexota bacterium]